MFFGSSLKTIPCGYLETEVNVTGEYFFYVRSVNREIWVMDIFASALCRSSPGVSIDQV